MLIVRATNTKTRVHMKFVGDCRFQLGEEAHQKRRRGEQRGVLDDGERSAAEREIERLLPASDAGGREAGVLRGAGIDQRRAAAASGAGRAGRRVPELPDAVRQEPQAAIDRFVRPRALLRVPLLQRGLPPLLNR